MEYYQFQLFAENTINLKRIKYIIGIYNAYATCTYKNCELTLTNYSCKTIKDVLILLIIKTRLNSVKCKSLIV